MGGQQSLALAGLRPDKITAALVCVPAGADSNGDLHGRKAGYPNWPSDNPEVMRTALYFDTVNFASRIQGAVDGGHGFHRHHFAPRWSLDGAQPDPRPDR